jgi:neural Wiskott-Aldrich syndrome protein
MPLTHRSSSSLALGHQLALHAVGGASDARAPTVLATASIARIYHTQLDAPVDEWTYSGQKGTLNFGRSWTPEHTTRSTHPSDSSSDSPYWLTLADEATGKTVWMFQIPASGFQYEVDKPFFHVFNGRVRELPVYSSSAS